MKRFTCTIADPAGLHARPAGLLVKAAREFSSSITLECGGRAAGATKLMALLTMGIRQGEAVTVTVEGPDEEEAAATVARLFQEHLCKPH